MPIQRISITLDWRLIACFPERDLTAAACDKQLAVLSKFNEGDRPGVPADAINSWPVRTSQNLTSPTTLPLTMVRPSGETPTLVTRPTWP